MYSPKGYFDNIDVTSNDGHLDLVDVGVCAQIKLTSLILITVDKLGGYFKE